MYYSSFVSLIFCVLILIMFSLLAQCVLLHYTISVHLSGTPVLV
jgi:hypothetical protein